MNTAAATVRAHQRAQTHAHPTLLRFSHSAQFFSEFWSCGGNIIVCRNSLFTRYPSKSSKSVQQTYRLLPELYCTQTNASKTYINCSKCVISHNRKFVLCSNVLQMPSSSSLVRSWMTIHLPKQFRSGFATRLTEQEELGVELIFQIKIKLIEIKLLKILKKKYVCLLFYIKIDFQIK